MSGSLGNSLSNQVNEVQQSLRDNTDAANAAKALWQPDSISTVMGRIKASGRQGESEIQELIKSDATLGGLVAEKLSQSEQQALINRMAQIAANVSEDASKAAT